MRADAYVKQNGIVPFEPFPLERSLGLLKNAEFVVTDSFHGTCLAILFKREFISVPRDFEDRFDSLLKRLGLEDRIITGETESFDYRSLTPIDWDAVYEKLEALRVDGLSYLKDSLKMENARPLRDYDMALREIERQGKEIRALRNRVAKFEGYLNKVKGTFPYRVYKKFRGKKKR
jgi:hypothetical protein